MQSLSRRELRQLRQAAMQLDFRYDIIGKIPPEIVLMVFQHLPIYQCFQARRVSRCWLERLLSRQILEVHLHQWYREDELKNHNIASMAEKFDAYQRISPFSMAIRDLRCYSVDDHLWTVAYGDGILAWIDGNESTKGKLQRLRGGVPSNFSSPQGTRLKHIAVSASMIAVIDESSICHIWDLRRLSQRLVNSFQVNPTLSQYIRIEEIRIAKQTLVIRTSEQKIISIHLDSPITTYEFSSPRDSSYRSCYRRIMLDHSGQHITLFSFDRKSGQINHTQYGLQGNLECGNSLLCPIVQSYDHWNESTQTVLQDYCSTIWTLMKRQLPNLIETSSWDILRVCYNQREQRLEFHNHTVHGLRTKDEITSAFVMNDVVYCRSSWSRSLESEDIELNAINLSDSSCERASDQADPCAVSWPFNDNFEPGERQRVSYLMSSIFFGDETFLINVSCVGLIIWCFGRGINMPWKYEGASRETDEGTSLESYEQTSLESDEGTLLETDDDVG